MSNPIRVLVFDDNRDRRESLKYLVGMQSDMVFVGAFEDASMALQRVQELEPDIVLMDIEMPGVNGIDAVREIKKAVPLVSVLMQTVFDEDEIIFQAIRAGASGYLIKKTSPQRIMDGIREAYKGGAPISPAIAMKVLRFFQEVPEQVASEEYQLTGREKEILGMLVDGKSYKMIAADIHLSYHTVNTHIRHIYEKLHVHSLGEAVAKAIRERLI